MSEPLVTVTLPTYQPDEKTFREAIDSLLNQSFRDFELLIVDDCSPDGVKVRAIVETYTDPRIRFVRNETNLQIAGTRAKMQGLARGKYIAVMDHDDISLPNRLQRQVELMEAHPEIGLCGTAHKRFGRLFKNNEIHYPVGDEELRAGLFFKCIIHHPSVMMRKSVLDANGISYDETMLSVNDRKLYMNVSEHAKLANIDEVLCLYRLHAGMTSRTQRDRIVAEQKRLRDLYLDRIGAVLDGDEKEILNQYVLRGRCRIRSAEILAQIEAVLSKISAANRESGYLPVRIFDALCAATLIKRCVNAMGYGRVPSGALLRRTGLPAQETRVPLALRVFNWIRRG